MFTVTTVTCPRCGNSANVLVHYKRRAVFGSCDSCGTLGTGMKNGLIENRWWVDLPNWTQSSTDVQMCTSMS